MKRALAGADDADRTDAVEARESQTTGDVHGPRVFAEPLRADGHGRGCVNEQVDRHALGGLVFFDVRSSSARGDAPVDGLDRVSRLIDAGLHIVMPRPAKRAVVGAVI